MDLNPARSRILPLTLSIALSFTAVSAIAEDGTSGSVPESSTCEIVSAKYSPQSASPVASPMASPVTTPMASPVASPVVEVDPAEQDLADASQAILNCMSENDIETLTKITSGEFRGSWLGLGGTINDADFAEILPMMPTLPYALVDVANTSVDGDAATATVRYTNGRQMHTAQWTYKLVNVDGQDVWRVQAQSNLPTNPPADAATMDLTVDDGSFSFSVDSIAEGDIVINVKNVGDGPHEVLIVRAAPGADAADFAAAPTGIPNGSTFIGQVTIPAGTEGAIVLKDVRVGTYTVVDLLPDASGMPNVSSGMYTTFEVAKP